MAARRPNVLIVLMDQLQRGALGSYGCRAARTPVFDLTSADGAIGSHAAAAHSAFRDFEDLADRIVEQMA